MNPSYNNGVGAQTPQGVPQMPIASGGMVVGGASEKKSRKGVVILIILVVVLALVGGAYLLWQNGVFGGGNTSRQAPTELQQKYNSYVNYVLYGVESDGALDVNAITATPYFEKLDEGDLTSYTAIANAKFEDFKQGYDAKEGEEKVDIAVLKSYFQDYPGVAEVDVSEVIGEYNKDGENAVKSRIDQDYNGATGEKYFDAFLKAQKELANVNLEIIMKASAAGCIKNNVLELGCSALTNDDRLSLNDKIVAAADTIIAMKAEAYNVIQNLYNELYGVADDVNGEENENE